MEKRRHTHKQKRQSSNDVRHPTSNDVSHPTSNDISHPTLVTSVFPPDSAMCAANVPLATHVHREERETKRRKRMGRSDQEGGGGQKARQDRTHFVEDKNKRQL